MANNNSHGPGQGAVNILHRIGTIIVDMIETRVNLVAVELEEEKYHLVNLLLMSGLAFISLLFGLVSLLILICWSIDPVHRLTALSIFTVVLLLVAAILAIATLKKAKSKKFLQEFRYNLKVDNHLLKGKKSD